MAVDDPLYIANILIGFPSYDVKLSDGEDAVMEIWKCGVPLHSTQSGATTTGQSGTGSNAIHGSNRTNCVYIDDWCLIVTVICNKWNY